jgi:hypothetical protein
MQPNTDKITKRKYLLALPLIILIIATLACAERQFGNTRVFSATPGTADKFYDQTADKILLDNVWVFHPDGTYDAVVVIEGQRKTISGRYGGDDSGEGFYFSIDTDNDGNYDDYLVASEGFMYLEWRRDSETLKYFLAP